MKVKRVLSKRYRSRTRSFSKERARDSKISFPLTAARRSRSRERSRVKREREREREKEIFPALFPFSTLDVTHKERASRGCTKTSPQRALFSPFTLQMHKKKKSYRMSGLHECQLYVSARRSLRIYNALSLSLSSLTECVCLCGPKSCFFSPLSLSPFLCFDLVVDKAAPAQISKNKKKREIALFLSLSRSLFHEKALFTPVRDAFSLPPRIFSLMSKAKKKAEKSKTFARNVFTKRAHSRMREEREKKTSDFERIELFSSSRCVLSLFFALARRRGRNFARRIERERGQRFAIFTSCLLTLQRER